MPALHCFQPIAWTAHLGVAVHTRVTSLEAPFIEASNVDTFVLLASPTEVGMQMNCATASRVRGALQCSAPLGGLARLTSPWIQSQNVFHSVSAPQNPLELKVNRKALDFKRNDFAGGRPTSPSVAMRWPSTSSPLSSCDGAVPLSGIKSSGRCPAPWWSSHSVRASASFSKCCGKASSHTQRHSSDTAAADGRLGIIATPSSFANSLKARTARSRPDRRAPLRTPAVCCEVEAMLMLQQWRA